LAELNAVNRQRHYTDPNLTANIKYDKKCAYINCSNFHPRVMEDFVDEVLRESASRANRGKAPLSYRQLRERWRDLADKKRAPAPTQQKQQSAGTGNGNTSSGGAGAGRGGGKTGGGGRGGRAGTQYRGTAAKFGGNPVCYLYNSRKTGCPRTAKPGGCDDGKNGIYAHVCNFELTSGNHCLAAHPRHANH